MRKLFLILALLPALANAQPPAPFYCVHEEMILDGWVNPFVGAPYSCEAIAPSTQYDSYTYYFPQESQAASDPVAAPEIDPATGVGALSFLAMLLLCCRPRRKRRSTVT